MPRKYSKKSQKGKPLKKRSRKQPKKAGMFKSLKKMVFGKQETKLYKEIEKFSENQKPKKQVEKDALSTFILKKTNQQNVSFKNLNNIKIKKELFEIAEKISYLDVTNPDKENLLNYLRIVLK